MKRILIMVLVIVIALYTISCTSVISQDETLKQKLSDHSTNFIEKIDDILDESLEETLPATESPRKDEKIGIDNKGKEVNSQQDKVKDILNQLLPKYIEASRIFDVGLDGSETEVFDENNVLYLQVEKYRSTDEIRKVAEEVYSEHYRKLNYQDNLDGDSPRYKDIDGILFTRMMDGFATNINPEQIISVDSFSDTEIDVTMASETGAGDWYKIIVNLLFKEDRWLINDIQHGDAIPSPY